MATEIANRFFLLAAEASEFVAPFLQRGAGNTGSLPGFLAGTGYDILGIGFLIFVLFIIGLSFGRSRLAIGIISLYVGAFFESLFPYHQELTSVIGKFEEWVRVGIFIFFYLVGFIFLNFSLLRSRLTLKELSFFSIIILSVVHAGFMLSLVLTLLPAEVLNNLSDFTINYFGTQKAQFIWASLGLLSFLFLGKKKRKDNN